MIVDPESKDGRNLLLRTEFQSQTEYATSVVIGRRLRGDQGLPQAQIIYGE